jgi:hypothetical protein
MCTRFEQMVTISYDHWSQIPRTATAWPYKYFLPQELACPRTGELVVVPKFVGGLDLLRSMYGSSLHLGSANRSDYHNAVVGGAPMSRHRLIFADAADISTIDRDRHLIKRLAKEQGFTGFGHYHTFIHVDMGRPREWGKEKWDA